MRHNPTLDIFIEVYKAYPASWAERPEVLEVTNSVILPPSALAKLAGLKKEGLNGSANPVLFRILNIELNVYTHCGVLDFTAEEDTVILPTNMFNRLYLQEGQMVNLRNTKLDKGKFIKIQPHLTEFINNPNPKVILENSLRNYFCVTEGDTILVKFNKKLYDIDIVECKPKKAIFILNCDVEVDFAPPKDYVEPKKEEPKVSSSGNKGSTVNFQGKEKPIKQLTDQEIKQLMEDKKFSGHYVRLDGKKITEKQIKKMEKLKMIHDNEENYNPRMNKIENKQRIHFHYVGSM